MDYKNLTHFPSLNFDAVAPDRSEFHAIVLRLTHQILPDGTLKIAAEQPPLALTDEYYGELGKSSVRQESDLAPFKPKCDVLVNGTASAPDGKPARRFEAGIKITKNGTVLLNKRVVVSGTRFWKKRFLPWTGWKLTEPESITSLPLRYDHAYGGECRTEKKHTCFEGNLIGRGFAEKWYLKEKKVKNLPAPQIEAPADPIRSLLRHHKPAGFGAVSRASLPRRKFVGTVDQAFIDSRKPLPDDFDFAFWNAAPPDQQIPWLSGGETIELLHIPITGAPGVTRLVLPEQNLCAKIAYESEEMAVLDFLIDTVILDADQGTVTLLYRLRLPQEPGIEKVETRFLTKESKAHLTEHCQAVNEATRQAKEPAYAG